MLVAAIWAKNFVVPVQSHVQLRDEIVLAIMTIHVSFYRINHAEALLTESGQGVVKTAQDATCRAGTFDRSTTEMQGASDALSSIELRARAGVAGTGRELLHDAQPWHGSFVVPGPLQAVLGLWIPGELLLEALLGHRIAELDRGINRDIEHGVHHRAPFDSLYENE